MGPMTTPTPGTRVMKGNLSGIYHFGSEQTHRNKNLKLRKHAVIKGYRQRHNVWIVVCPWRGKLSNYTILSIVFFETFVYDCNIERRWEVVVLRVRGFAEILAFPAILLCIVSSAMSANFSCKALGERELSDGELFQKHNGWDVVKPQDKVPPNTSDQFIYVAKSTFGNDRGGILVVKTGRELSDRKQDIAPTRKRIWLERNEDGASRNKNCEFKPFNRTRVVSKFYDEYHDADFELKGKEGAEALQIFNDFHTNYEPTKSSCKGTKDVGWDSVFPLDRRSNRSQYSFDKIVVQFGLGSPFWKFILASTADGSAGLVDQKVQSIRYRTTDGVACVRISAAATSEGSFLRINDLEGRNSVTFIRRGEMDIRFGR